MDPLSQGREHYLKKDYKKALEIFTDMIQASTNHIRLSALDHRAATYEKLNEFQLALRDARDMIVLKPELAKGYLRCGKVLQLMKKDTLALQIYERGLGKVKIGEDPDRPLLQRMYAKLQQMQKPSRNLDPLVMLPNELALLVCYNLSMRDRVICLSVSKPWKRFLESSSDLWTTLDMRLARRGVRMDALKAYLRRSNYGVNRAYLFFRHSDRVEQLELVIRSCKRLEFLECNDAAGYALGNSILSPLRTATSLRTLIIKNCTTILSHVVQALSICPLLEHAAFHRVSGPSSSAPAEWPHLEKMASMLIDCHRTIISTGQMNMNKLKTSTPNLRSLTLGGLVRKGPEPANKSEMDFNQWNQLERFVLGSSTIVQFPKFPPTLKFLNLSGLSLLTPAKDPGEHNLPLLEVFMCDHTDLSEDDIFKITQSSIKNGNLRVLRMAGLIPVEETVMNQILAAPQLNELSLRGCRIPERALLKYLRLCPTVQYLDLSRTLATGVTIKELMTRPSGPLKWLAVDVCSNLSPDAVDYARSLGCEVEYHPATSSSYVIKSFRDRMTMSGL